MKTNVQLVKYILRLALTLLLITSVVAAVLAGVNAITAPRIAEQKAQKTQSAIEAVLPGGGESVAFTDGSGMVRNVYKGSSGYAVQVVSSGFNGEIDMMVGVAEDGTLLGVSIISHTETAGLGAVAAAQTAAGESFRGQFAGMSGAVTVSKDGGQVEALTGATITSRAVCAGISAATACVENMG